MKDSLEQSYAKALASSRARIGQLEQEANARKGEAEESTRAHLERYELLLFAIGEVIWTHDSQGEMRGDQLSWTRYTGQTFGQYHHYGWLGAVHPDDCASTVDAWKDAVLLDCPYEIEHRLRRADGQYRYFAVRVVPVRDKDGRTREWAGIHTDITERKQTEQTLRDGEREFRELADSMPQIVWAADSRGSFDYYNRRWYEFTGRPEGVRGDESWTDVVHPDDQKECLARWRSATQSGDAYEIEYRLKEKGGNYHWFLRRALPVRDAAGAITRWFGTCTNIDTVKQTEMDLRCANVKAEAAKQELEAFSYAVAHDLRAPLRSIDGFSQAILADSADCLDEQAKSNLARVRGAAQRMGRLIDGLLSLSRVSRSALRREQVDLTGMARAIATRFRENDPGRKVEIVVQDELAADGDVTLLGVVLENLLGNAWKFTSHRSEGKIEVGHIVMNGQPAYYVRDNGAGFDTAYANKLFEAFQRLHAAVEFPGDGIGLATVQRIVRRHDGRIWAESEVDRGATFFFTLGFEA
jgi:PAS domain S-box-containing protein